MKVQCCVCKKVRSQEKWVTPLNPLKDDEQVSHGYCPSCADTAFAELRAEHQAKRTRNKKDTYAA